MLNPTITSSIPGVFQVTFTDNQCQMSITSSINFKNYAVVNAIDTVLCAGGSADLSCGQYPQNNHYVWSDGTTGPIIHAVAGNEYVVTASNECNSDSDTLTVGIKVCDVNAPNIIVLSSTSGNNKFTLDFDGVKEFKITIVNRWGNLINEFSDPGDAWDGKNLHGEVVTEGIYFYNFEALMENNQTIKKQGFIQVIH